ncbi:phosphotransferase family protein [Azospirillum picis]|uniref:Aminoglycoside phosphotransferase (APT) family kinase protein n=1 Tax=Azospirillum picis TaxID=488438 RepID=A0ABU0MRU2_9PROT|nr:phosphotransferase family protein [Azospirillum picis]MBP2302583.1 aminoglycoside phosphotransferase (APT) family kinase protein [Azospirillum picis]MDQ0536175.1 aminoglycoside phosphotransferase (APT) family kinase protein [Azospirillum picis]
MHVVTASDQPSHPLLAGDSRSRLERWLAAEAGASRVTVSEDGRLGGGAISLNLAVTLEVEGGPFAGSHACVLRAEGGGRISASIGKLREFAVLRVAFEAGVMAPEPLIACDDPAILGRDFYIMRRAEGLGAGHAVTRTEAAQPELARALGRQLGLLHRVGPETPGLERLAEAPDCPAQATLSQFRQWFGELARRDPVIAWGLRWMEINAPAPGAVVLCHRDYRTGNYLVKDGALTAILDWEFAGFSDPMEDLGWFCARSWRFRRPDREAGGIADREDFYAGYEETSGRRIDPVRVAYWETAAYLRWAAVAVEQGNRHSSGAEPSLELALTGRMLPEIEMDLLRHLRAIGRTASGAVEKVA